MAGRKHYGASKVPAAASAPKLAVALFALLAFMLQSYVTQTHIHIPGHIDFGDASANVPAKLVPSQNGDHDKYPAKDDPANCPLCQAVAYAGAFVTPAAPVLILPVQIAAHPLIVIAWPGFIEAVSHSWYGRAPPSK